MTSEGCLRHIGWKLLPFFFLVSACCCLPDGDLCRWMNGRKYYIDVGESGIISAENVTSQSKAGSSNHPQIPQRCSVELVTCSSCHFKIYATRINIPTCSSDNTCRCDFVWVKESAYTKSGQEFCGRVENNSTSLIFESKTKQVSVDFLYTGSYTSAFALHFSAIKNVYVYKGGFDYYQANSTGVFNSPNFPGGYPSDYSAEYILQNVDNSGFVQLLFTDFQLSLWSYMEIVDSNGSRIDVYNGNTFRPPAIISSGPTLTIKFHANDEYSSSGFRATYTFVGYAEKYWVNRPSTDCGGFVEDFGGAITMMNMVPGNMMRAFDCIWLIRPRSGTIPGKQVSVRVGQFEDMGPKSTLSIRQGLYSDAPLLESVTPFQHHELHRGQEYVVPASIGFYIRLVGYFKNKSHLAIIYSTFQYEGCYAIVDFECGNRRCIKNTLRCDGFNHCGDGSDESSCYGANQGTQSPEDANWWRTLTPNYYFPKSDASNNAGTNTLILVTSLAGLGMFVLTTIVILVKLHKQRQEDSISREILQTISADIDAENALQHHRGSDPPIYDPPPSYDDVIKFYLPPPPAYSRIGSIQNTQTRSGTCNAAHSPHMGRSRGRQTKLQKPIPTLHESLPTILQVSLPKDDDVRHSQTATKKSDDDSSLNQSSNSNPSTSVTIQHLENQVSPKTLGNSGMPVTTSDLNHAISEPMVSQQLITNFHDNVINPSSHRSVCFRTNSSCECQGACSCSTNYHLPPQQSNNKTCSECDTSYKDSNFNEQSDDESIISISPKQPQTKILGDAVNQRIDPNDGPSTNSEHCSSIRFSHRRSSSDPSEISCPENYSQGRTTIYSSPPTTDVSNETKNLASSAPTGGLHQSLSFRRGSASGMTDAKSEELNQSDNILPLGWGTLWNPVRRRPETHELAKPVSEYIPWLQSDKQPLLWKLSKNSFGEVTVQERRISDLKGATNS